MSDFISDYKHSKNFELAWGTIMPGSKNEKLKAIELGIRPEAAVSGAIVIESESLSFLIFNAMKTGPTGTIAPAGTAVIAFKNLIKSQFGHPNDEALAGHPLAAYGLNAYGIFEVENSHWIKTVCDQNRKVFPQADWFGKQLKHFIFTFHDSTFECLADSMELSLHKESYAEILENICRKILHLK